jgi:hypothetical protein
MKTHTQSYMRGVAFFVTLCVMSAFGLRDARAQTEQTEISFHVPGKNTEVTQNFPLEAGDKPHHLLPLFEVHRTFPDNPPIFAGVRVKDQWNRGFTDLVDNDGTVVAYYVIHMDNGDKVLGAYHEVAQWDAEDYPGTRVNKGILVLTGGTGKLRGIRGRLRVTTLIDSANGVKDTAYDGEYWFEGR